MKDIEAAQLLNKHDNFFAVMKCINKEMYDYIQKRNGKNLVEKFTAYEEEQQTVLEAWAEEYYWLEDNRLIYQFSKLIHKKELATNDRSFSTGASGTIFNGSNKFSNHKTYIKYIKMLIVLKYFKKGKEKINDL